MRRFINIPLRLLKKMLSMNILIKKTDDSLTKQDEDKLTKENKAIENEIQKRKR